MSVAGAISLRAVLASLALVAATLAAYAGVGGHEFIAWDDDEYVYQNPFIAGGLTPASLRWALTTGWVSNWHPLTWVSHMLDVELYGTQAAGGHHVTNLLLHLLNTLLTFAALRQLTGAFWRSWCVAALFGLHPLHVESVAWISERKDVLSQLFWLASIYAYARFAHEESRRWYVASASFLALGLMAKSMLVTAPFLYLLLDHWPLDRLRGAWRARVIEKLPMLALVAAASCVTFLVQRSGGAVGYEPWGERLVIVIVGYGRYLAKMFWPVDLAVFYPKYSGLYSFGQLGAAVFVLGALSVAAWHWRRHGYVWIGWLWFLGTLFPVSGIVPIGAHAMADRYTYMPMGGIAVAVVWAVADGLRGPAGWTPPRRAMAIGLAVMGLAACAAATRAQVAIWHDSETLFRHALAVTRNNDTIHHNLGVVLQREGRVEEARAEYLEVLRRDPLAAETLYNLGTLHRELGEWEVAEQWFLQSVGADPLYPEPQHAMGALRERDGAVDGAVAHYEAALRAAPDYAPSQIRLGLLRFRLGQPEIALAHLREGARLRPDSPEVRVDLGQVLFALGRPEEAVDHLRAAIALRPGYAEAHDALGRMLAETGDLDGAISEFREALRIDPELAAARHNLAVAEAAQRARGS